MSSIYKDKYKEGDYFDSYKKVTTLDEALKHPLVHREGIEFYGPKEGWQEDGYMYRVNLSSEAMNYWVSCEIGEHMSAINLYGETEKEAREQVLWLLNDSFSYMESK